MNHVVRVGVINSLFLQFATIVARDGALLAAIISVLLVFSFSEEYMLANVLGTGDYWTRAFMGIVAILWV